VYEQAGLLISLLMAAAIFLVTVKWVIGLFGRLWENTNGRSTGNPLDEEKLAITIAEAVAIGVNEAVKKINDRQRKLPRATTEARIAPPPLDRVESPPGLVPESDEDIEAKLQRLMED